MELAYCRIKQNKIYGVIEESAEYQKRTNVQTSESSSKCNFNEKRSSKYSPKNNKC